MFALVPGLLVPGVPPVSVGAPGELNTVMPVLLARVGVRLATALAHCSPRAVCAYQQFAQVAVTGPSAWPALVCVADNALAARGPFGGGTLSALAFAAPVDVPVSGVRPCDVGSAAGSAPVLAPARGGAGHVRPLCVCPFLPRPWGSLPT